MNFEVRISGPTLRLLKEMLESPRSPTSGAELSKRTKIGSGTLYPLLQRLEHVGWLTSKWEDVDPAEVKRPRRRYYKLTRKGWSESQRALGAVQSPSLGEVSWNF